MQLADPFWIRPKLPKIIHVGLTFSAWPEALKVLANNYPATNVPPMSVLTQNIPYLNILPFGDVKSSVLSNVIVGLCLIAVIRSCASIECKNTSVTGRWEMRMA
jgi:hypothetical protein